MKSITSRTNPEVQKLRTIRDGKDKNLFFCEGEKVVRDLLASKLETTKLYATKPLNFKTTAAVTLLAPAIMDYVSDMSSAPGLIAVAKRPQPESEPYFGKNPLILFLIGLQLPQNLGALLRTAEAAGVTHVLVSTGSCDPYNPKAVRGSTGSVFRLDIRTGLDPLPTISRLRSQNIQTAAAHQDGKISYSKADWNKPIALLVGSEGQGFADDLLQEIDTTVKIPMQGKVESLNAGVAAALCLYEAHRQRHELTA